MLAEQVIEPDESTHITVPEEPSCSDVNREYEDNTEGYPDNGGNEETDQLAESGNLWLSRRRGQSVFVVSSMEGNGIAKGKRLRGATEDIVESYMPERIYRPRARSRLISASGIVDSGASWSIAVLHWVKKWSNLTSPEDWQKCVTASTRRFRFGDSRLFYSVGSILLNASAITDKDRAMPFLMEVDVIDQDVPLLLARTSLSKNGRMYRFQDPHFDDGRSCADSAFAILERTHMH